MKITIQNRDITVEVRPQFLLVHTYIDGLPFKRKYVGYNEREARKAFMNYVKEEASKIFVNKPV